MNSFWNSLVHSQRKTPVKELRLAGRRGPWFTQDTSPVLCPALPAIPSAFLFCLFSLPAYALTQVTLLIPLPDPAPLHVAVDNQSSEPSQSIPDVSRHESVLVCLLPQHEVSPQLPTIRGPGSRLPHAAPALGSLFPQLHLTAPQWPPVSDFVSPCAWSTLALGSLGQGHPILPIL